MRSIVTDRPPVPSAGAAGFSPGFASGFDAEPVAQRLKLRVAERVEPGRVEDCRRGLLVAGADLAERLGGG
jgi:hypothetical protein